MKKIISFMIIFVLLSFSVLGVAYWTQDGNVDLHNTGSGEDFTAYAYNQVNLGTNVNNESYEKCSISSSDFQPVMYDIRQDDGIPDVLLFTDLQINIYNTNCALQDIIQLDYGQGTRDNFVTAPQLVYTDTQSETGFDIILVNSYKMFALKYIRDTEDFFVSWTVDYNTTTENKPFVYTTCIQRETTDNTRCFGFVENSSDVYVIERNGVGADITVNEDELNGTVIAPADNEGYVSLTSQRILGNTNFRIPMCYTRGLNNLNQSLVCNILGETGYLQWSDTVFGTGTSLPIKKIHKGNVYFSKIDNTNILVASVSVLQSNDGILQSQFMYSLSGENLVKNTQSAEAGYSNFAVGDFDKDGRSEACYLRNSAFTCLDVDGDVDFTVADTGVGANAIDSFIMGELWTNTDYLTLYAPDRFLQWNGSAFNVTTVETTSVRDEGFIGTLYGSTVGVPMIIYVDRDTGYILLNLDRLADCGDGTCSGLENFFNCPADCNITTVLTTETVDLTDPCIDDADCNLGSCQFKVCTLINVGECDENGDCVSGECINNVCKKPTLWQSIDNAKDDEVGDDSNTNLFLSLLILVVVCGAILAFGRGNPLAIILALGVFISGTIFFAIVGWIPLFLLLVPLLLIVVGIVAILIFGRG